MFALQKGPGERIDLAGQAAHGPLIRELFATLLDLQKQFDDPLELISVFPQWMQQPQ